MAQFKYAHAGHEYWRDAADACIMQLGEIPPAANLGFIYVTDSFAADLPDLLAYLKPRLSVPHWVGTVGIGICAGNKEYFDEPGLALMLADFAPGSFQVFDTISTDLDEFHGSHAEWYGDKQALFGMVHGDPHNNRLPFLLTELSDKLEESFLVGGLTSSRTQHYQVADLITEGGLSGVLFSKQVQVSTRLSQGCSPIGKRHEITECRDNILVRLDNRPALDVLQHEVQTHMRGEWEQDAVNVFAALPVPGSDTGDFMVRNLVGVDVENRLLAIGESVTPGMQLMFTRRDSVGAEEDLRRVLQRLAGSLQSTPRGAVYYTCLGRGQNLFSTKSLELHIIEEELGRFPLVGFFGGGEISHNRIYGYTGVLTLFL